MNCARQERCFFFCYGMESRRTFFFFFPEADKGGGKKKKKLFEFLRGENRKANREALQLPVPTRGHRPGSIPGRAGPCLPAPHGPDGPFFWAIPAPSSRSPPGGARSQSPPGCLPPQPGRQQAPRGARPSASATDACPVSARIRIERDIYM